MSEHTRTFTLCTQLKKMKIGLVSFQNRNSSDSPRTSTSGPRFGSPRQIKANTVHKYVEEMLAVPEVVIGGSLIEAVILAQLETD